MDLTTKCVDAENITDKPEKNENVWQSSRWRDVVTLSWLTLVTAVRGECVPVWWCWSRWRGWPCREAGWRRSVVARVCSLKQVRWCQVNEHTHTCIFTESKLNWMQVYACECVSALMHACLLVSIHLCLYSLYSAWISVVKPQRTHWQKLMVFINMSCLRIVTSFIFHTAH